jgi:cytochrome c biogenesis protein CcdA
VKTLLILKSVVEAPTGLLIFFYPSTVVWLLFGSALAPPWNSVARLMGIVLLILGIACWLARNRALSLDARRLILGLLGYDAAVVGTLLVARFGLGTSGALLWPGVLLHGGLGIWSVLEIGRG